MQVTDDIPKPERDARLYRRITFPNGLEALLISDPSLVRVRVSMTLNIKVKKKKKKPDRIGATSRTATAAADDDNRYRARYISLHRRCP